ncbi:MAG: hypothetical protein AAGF04_01410 [Chlamydiota bacterium]
MLCDMYREKIATSLWDLTPFDPYKERVELLQTFRHLGKWKASLYAGNKKMSASLLEKIEQDIQEGTFPGEPYMKRYLVETIRRLGRRFATSSGNVSPLQAYQGEFPLQDTLVRRFLRACQKQVKRCAADLYQLEECLYTITKETKYQKRGKNAQKSAENILSAKKLGTIQTHAKSLEKFLSRYTSLLEIWPSREIVEWIEILSPYQTHFFSEVSYAFSLLSS